MHDKKPPTFAFVGWNSFQMLRFKRLAQALPGSVLVLEKRPGRPCDIPDDYLTSLNPPMLVWPSKRLHELDGVFDVIVCQTTFPQLERFQRSKIAMLQYGLAKEPYNYGSWRALADLCLVYGQYSARKIEAFCPVVSVGSPHFDAWHEPEFHEQAKQKLSAQLDPAKKTVLYVPTWGPLSTQEQFISEVEKLADEYNVLIKLHHNTSLLEHERGPRSSPSYFGPSTDLLELLALSDVVLSDYSGAIFDALYCQKPVVLLQSQSAARFGNKLDATSLEFAQRDRIGLVVEESYKLRGSLQRLFAAPTALTAAPAERLTAELFVRGPGATERASAALLELASTAKRAPRLSSPDSSAALRENRERDFVNALRAKRPRLALLYVKVRTRLTPKLYLYRAGIRAAAQLQAYDEATRLARLCEQHFPEVTMDSELLRFEAASPGSTSKPLRVARQEALKPTRTGRSPLTLVSSALALAAARPTHDAASYAFFSRVQLFVTGHPFVLEKLSRALRALGRPLEALALRALFEQRLEP